MKKIVIDGMDGSGKDTQFDKLKQAFPNAFFTREPGGPGIGEDLRHLLINDPRAKDIPWFGQFLLFWANRAISEHEIEKAGHELVFKNRGASSTWAFQICGEEKNEFRGYFWDIYNMLFSPDQYLNPNLYIVFDLPAETARERANRRAGDQTHYDTRPLEYYQRVRDGFIEFANGENVEFVDASKSVEEVFAQTMAVLAKHGITP
jgi:dTMP kinase